MEAHHGSFYWYDLETFGADPRKDRAAQFAGIRTDYKLNPLGQSKVIFCRPSPDFLPVPEACLITGITPQKAALTGLPEAGFMSAIQAEFSVPDTCVAGFNNIRFDDEVIRHGFYRNLLDPYDREWRHGNSRWDLIDVMRFTRAMRPEGIEWPTDDLGRPSFRLEKLTAANGISHSNAHDAMADVEATIALARLLQNKQPRLFDFLFSHRSKHDARKLLNPGSMEPLIHTSEKYPAEKFCTAMVVALAPDPVKSNEIIVYDLAVDPTPLLTLEVDVLRERLFTASANLPPGVERLPIKTVRINRCPVLAPINSLRKEDAERLGWNLDLCRKHLEELKNTPGLVIKVQMIMQSGFNGEEPADPDLMLYTGGFLNERDKRSLEKLRAVEPEAMGRQSLDFSDNRLEEMVFRYRARNYPETLDREEQERWQHYRKQRLTDCQLGASIVREDYEKRLMELGNRPDLSTEHQGIIKDLWQYLLEVSA